MTDVQPQWVRKPKAPPADVVYAHKLGRGMLVPHQRDELVKAINTAYVAQKNKMSYLAQHQARAEMNRIFGYGNWDSEVASMRCDYEERLGDNTDPRWPKDYKTKAPKVSGSGAYWIVGYEGSVRITIRDLWGMPIATYLEFHFEESAPQPNRGEARALALTSVESYALRRALINLGDRFGLGLYNGGSTAPHGQYTVQLEPGILFDWVDERQAPVAPALAPVQPNHQTIAAEPAVAEGWEGQALVSSEATAPAAPARAKRLTAAEKRQKAFTEAQTVVQDSNQQARDTSMAARLQAGMKVDAREADFQQYTERNDYENAQAAQQADGGGVVQ